MEQIWQLQPSGWVSPFSCQSPFAPELRHEYGVDACRVASISSATSQNSSDPHLLEPAFKWLAKLQNLFRTGTSHFSAIPWLEAGIQAHDHILLRDNPRAALTTLRHAVKVSPPSADNTISEKALILACLAPFAPVLATHEASLFKIELLSMPEIIKSFDRHICIRFSLGDGGWNQKVFDRARFQQNPLEELKKLKQVKIAIGKRSAQLRETEGGLKICFL